MTTELRKVTDKHGRFIGGAAAARARHKTAGKKIQNPMVREKLKEAIGFSVHPQERFMAAILRSLPRDVLRSHSFPKAREELRTEMCQRVQLPKLAPLKASYNSMREFNQMHAAMVLEEGRHIIAEALYKRWGKDRVPSKECLAMDFLSNDTSMKNSEHLIYRFQSKNTIPPDIKSQFKPGSVVELIPIGYREMNVENIVLGNIVRDSNRPMIDFVDDEVELLDMDKQVSIMIYNRTGVNFKHGVGLVILGSLLNLTRQFDACTNGANHLNYEILGVRNAPPKKPVHTKFESEDEAGSDFESTSVYPKIKKEEEFAEEEEEEASINSVFVKAENISDELPELPLSNDIANINNHLAPKHSDCSIVAEDTLLAQSGYQVPHLNESQNRAVNAFLDSKHERISIVQGPPGTGKTTLLVSLICRYLIRIKSFDNHEQRQKRLLICAPTNKAVIVLASRFLWAMEKASDDYNVSVVLIGDQERLLADDSTGALRRRFVYTWRESIWRELDQIERRLNIKTISPSDTSSLAFSSVKICKSIKQQIPSLIDDELHSIFTSLEENLPQIQSDRTHHDSRNLISVFKVEIRKLIKKIKSFRERDVISSLLADATLIFCTLSSAGSQIMKETTVVDDLIVDEAAAATIPELCIGLWLVENRLLLVGDPKQLPATVNSDYSKNNGLDTSLQDRLMNQNNFPYVMLDMQYRMNKEISQFPSSAFYGGKVKDGENVLAFSYQPEASLIDGKPYCFVQVASTPQKDSYGSRYNTAECDIVIGLLKELQHCSRHLDNNGWAHPDRIRVITFYQAQVNQLRNRIRNMGRKAWQDGFHNVLLSTVDSSQGCEADIIILSLVRQGGDQDPIGFLRDQRRLNVSLTRAKHQLVCVGNVRSLSQTKSKHSNEPETIAQLAMDAIDRKCIFHNYKPGGEINEKVRHPKQRHNRRKNHQRKRTRNTECTSQLTANNGTSRNGVNNNRVSSSSNGKKRRYR